MAGRFERWARIALISWSVASVAQRASAQDQVVILDETYTATSANTSDSHYRLPPRAGSPDDWEEPVDYAAGRAHVRLEVIEKPSDAPTLYNVCFEATPTYACLPYSPEYTAPGVYDYEYGFGVFYQGNQVDWSQGTNQIALILKDENEVKPQGDPDFYPTKIHVTITLLTADAVYVPPSDEPDPELDAGYDAGMLPDPVDAGALDASVELPDAAGPTTQPDAMPPMMVPSGGTSAPPIAGVGAGGAGGIGGEPPPQASSAAGTQAPPPSDSGDDSGCSVRRVRSARLPLAWLALALCALISSFRSGLRARS